MTGATVENHRHPWGQVGGLLVKLSYSSPSKIPTKALIVVLTFLSQEYSEMWYICRLALWLIYVIHRSLVLWILNQLLNAQKWNWSTLFYDIFNLLLVPQSALHCLLFAHSNSLFIHCFLIHNWTQLHCIVAFKHILISILEAVVRELRITFLIILLKDYNWSTLHYNNIQ